MVSLLLAVLLLLVADFDFGFGFDGVSAKAIGSKKKETVTAARMLDRAYPDRGYPDVSQSQPGQTYVLQSQPEAQTPTAYTTGGGGFWTMTDSMGIIRAWHESNILEHNTTHFGGSSGGSWFQTQFSYSQEFYESAIGMGRNNGGGNTVSDFVTEWGTRYGQQMRAAIANEEYQDLRFTLASSSSKCLLDGIPLPNNETGADLITDLVDKILEDTLYFPANNWYYYIGAMLSSYIPNAATSLFSTPRTGFAKGTLVIASSFGPDIYPNNPGLPAPKLYGLPNDVTLLPIAYRAPEGQTGGWDLTAATATTSSATTPLEIGVKGNTTRVPMTSLPVPSIVEVASASSSFLGMTGSPTLFENLVKNYINGKFTNATFAKKKLIETALNLCLPVGLQNTSSPTEGNEASSVSSWSPMYRYLDGGYTEGSSVSQTIADMQKSCRDHPSMYDCTTNGLRLSNIVGNNAPSAVTGEQNGIPRLFANCNCGTTNDQAIGNSFNPQIFAEDFPTDLTDTKDGWYLYSTKVYEFNNNTEPSLSYALRMNVTTVDNVAFGVTGGMQVEIIIFFPDLPPQEKEIWPGLKANYAFSTIYAQTAEEQYSSALKLFTAWNLSSAWGTGPSQQPTMPTPSPTVPKKKSPKKKSPKVPPPPPGPPKKSIKQSKKASHVVYGGLENIASF